MHVNSTDGVQIAVHELAGSSVDPPLLVSHATGFHGRCYLPLAWSLAGRHHSTGFDYRGHGDTALPAELADRLNAADFTPPLPIEWKRYGDDAAAMATEVAHGVDAPIAAFGHSMGGACLLMAAHRDPTLFSALVLYEPIVFPPGGIPSEGGAEPPGLAAGARRRRAVFPSYDDAIANFSRKFPLSGFTPAALEAYVRYGFRESDDGQVHLKCHPEVEAGTFDSGGTHLTWDVLPEITTPVLVLSGVHLDRQPSAIAPGVAERLPNSTFVQLDDLDHFGPMTAPARIAEIIADFVAEATRP